jgi:hypothetical protein
MRLSSTHVKHSHLLTLALPVIMGLLAIPAMLTLRHASTRSTTRTQATPPTFQQARETYGQIPLSFESNQGQTDASVNFLARGAGYTLFLKPTEAVFALRNSDCESRNEERAGRSLKTDAPHSTANPQSAIRNRKNPRSVINNRRCFACE